MTAGLSLVALAGIAGLSIDLGRFYIARNELQTYCDAAALAAAIEINGTTEGITAAKAAAVGLPNKWNFGTTELSGTQVKVEFAATPTSTAWVVTPDATQAKTFVNARVTATVPLKLYLLPTVNTGSSAYVQADAVAGRLTSNSVVPGNLLPFSPIAPTPTDTANFGFVKGVSYTLRWSSNVGNSGPAPNGSMCAGDLALGHGSGSTLERVRNGPSATRGYWGTQSGNELDNRIENGYQSTVAVGDLIEMVTGSKNGRKNAMEARVQSDTDHTNVLFTSYENNRVNNIRVGNGRRIIVVPINSGEPGSSTNGGGNGNGNGNGNNSTNNNGNGNGGGGGGGGNGGGNGNGGGPEWRPVIGFAAFFMNNLSYDDTAGNEPFCAEYLGAYVQGANSHSGGGNATVSKVRLVRWVQN